MKAACCVLLLSLLMVLLLRTVYQRLFSMAAEAYTPGSLSAAFVTCPNEKDDGREAPGCLCQHHASDHIHMIKTRSSRIPALTDFVRSVHPYEVAEVIALPIQQGNAPYLQWVGETVPE
ncbi:protein CutA isoform X3 [Chrysemys picta bellii]|uniref:protein CutA isoform X3 n=1 Tax=Chrysemys picta bellii TaxID=8478 RepID=UPI000CE64CB0|nr:protein CutA isoform X3 [Chrysemys picta bellii]